MEGGRDPLHSSLYRMAVNDDESDFGDRDSFKRPPIIAVEWLQHLDTKLTT
jgi:tRNA A37 threonylcarbamoyladenosine biosynthesis protein TsaE